MSGPVRWAISPTDGRTHALLPVGDHPLGVLPARRGQLLPWQVARYECLPGRLLCVSCLWCYMVPAPVLPRRVSAGRRSSPAPPLPAPGGQPVPDPPVPDPPTTEIGTAR